jgi:hypothetical protein
MTDTILPGYPSVRESDWSKALAEYKDACNAMRGAAIAIEASGKDMPEATVRKHDAAARALIYTPASHVVHIAQKLRAIDNLFAVSLTHPGLIEILTLDLVRLVGLEGCDEPVLPPALQAKTHSAEV